MGPKGEAELAQSKGNLEEPANRAEATAILIRAGLGFIGQKRMWMGKT